CQNYLSIPFTF
nr:immunoglobulin light chain junction region [Macaca mulatta]MOX47810.1 immunoglobulin light chain junction region [Macaca mulatta]MOX48089.1 immunoglobulin light chain junction region [Macaca mulatta]MOX48223.1 immunoglobulin light chain junction region [Macaca mulatta]MOX48419.1 immunoglobulin light chain junction region [Macaca mulatta]